MNHRKPRYRVNDAFRLLGLARSTGYRVVKAGRLKTYKDGRRVFVNADEIDRYTREAPAP